ncbi:nuclease HARBI1 [Pyrus ussuriensis x Pyrus communis]|uniref:Nuclease HARBI1 n=1 Tax=Pyrus ussuriensis x Pyrus communis TaxID=2448454 RepID=A0A5N5H2Y9_9ROSA|nr:nuclease HARBI1 [Pyrus ussuriensis x Pyrus communis]
MGRASHSHRVIQAMAQICRPSHSGNLDRSRQRRGMELLDDYFVPNSAFPDTYFRRHAFGAMGLLPKQKIIVALQMLAYGAFADQVDEITRMGKSTILESLMRFCEAIESIYIVEYLRKPTNMDLERLLKKAEMRGFPGMIGSIDWPQALGLAILHGPGTRASTFTRACPRWSRSTGPRAPFLSPVPRATAHAGLALSALEDTSELSAIDTEGKVTHEEFEVRGGLFVVAENLLVLFELGRDGEVVKEMGDGEGAKEKKTNGSAARGRD